MQKITVTLSFDDEKLRALDTYLKMQNTTVQKKLETAMSRLYEETVPKPVQEYLDALGGAKAKRPAPKSQPAIKSSPGAKETAPQQQG